MSETVVDPHWLMAVIRECWSPETTDDWHADFPAAHQCAVTALVMQDYLGGEIHVNKFGTRVVWFNHLPSGEDVFHVPGLVYIPREFAFDRVDTREKTMHHPDMPRRYALLKSRVAGNLAVREAAL